MSVDIIYHSFNETRADKKWDSFWSLSPEKQLQMLEIPNWKITKENLENDLLDLDLRFGAVSTVLYEPIREEAFLFILLSVFVPQSPRIKESLYDDNGVLKINAEEIQMCIDLFDEEKIRTWITNANIQTAQKIDIWEEDLVWVLPDISEFLERITPIIHDLLQNPTSIFIWEVNGDKNSQLLQERKRVHLEQLLRDHPEISEENL